MRLCPCRFNVPLTDNEGQAIDPQVILDLQRELLEQFGGFTILPTSQGRWQSRAGRVYQEEVVVYEVAVPEDKVPLAGCRLPVGAAVGPAGHVLRRAAALGGNNRSVRCA